ncbi:hypothetical protein [Nostoc sp. CALU 546]
MEGVLSKEDLTNIFSGIGNGEGGGTGGLKLFTGRNLSNIFC